MSGAEPKTLVERQVGLSPSKRALLQRLKGGRGGESPAPSTVPRRPASGAAPLSFAQQRLWFLDRLDPGHPAYNLATAVLLKGRLRHEALVQGLGEVMRRHEVLRTGFREVDGEPRQEVAAGVTWEMPRVDLTALEASRRSREAGRLACAIARRRLDLGRPPLLLARLLRLNARRHTLLVVLHHVVSDGWSFGVFVREIATLYRAWHEGRPSPLAELPIQYADYALWQRRRMEDDGASLTRSLTFWRRALAGLPALDLPTDRPRPPARAGLGGTVRKILSVATLNRLEAVAKDHRTTPFVALVTAFQILLARAADVRDLAVGTPVAHRTLPETEGLIGFFVNTLVLRCELSGDPAFPELLGRARERVLDAFAHQEVPFERLVSDLVPERNLSQNPLFQVMFAFQNTPRPPLELPELALERQDPEAGTAPFDLSVSCTRTSVGLEAAFLYDRDLFDRTTILRWAEQWTTLLSSLAMDPERRLSALSVASPGERHQVLGEWNDAARPFSASLTLPDLVSRHVLATPDAVAVVAGGIHLSYGALGDRARRLARRLAAAGVGRETPVPVALDRGVELPLALLAVHLAGGAYVPIDPAHPAERIRQMVTEAAGTPGARPALTRRDLRPHLPGDGVEWLDVDSPAETPEVDLSPALHPDQIAYVLYTSGSTGRPKGVACSHRSAVNLIESFDRCCRRPSGDRVSSWTSFGFDVSVWEIFSALAFGGTLCIPGEAERATAEGFLPWLHRHAVLSAYVPPFFLPELAAEAESGGAGVTLERLLVGVEPIPEELLQRLRHAVPHLAVINGYGPTEGTVCASFYPVPKTPAWSRRTPLGRPVDNDRIVLLDRHGEPAPLGAPGEIFLGGVGLARGYHRAPARTAERFVPDPHGARPGARLYRTGDRARRLPTGDLLFLGRLDDQLKVRGFRVEPGEVEAILAHHPGVAESAVLAWGEEGTPERSLAAFVVAIEPGAVSPDALRAFLLDRLPAYMVPSGITLIDALPRTPNGKLDRQVLPAPEAMRPEDTLYRPPVTAAERLLAELWSELLGVERVGLDDGFFDLGGHSLLAGRLLVRIRARSGAELPLRAVFEAPTLEALARRVEAAGAGPGEVGPVAGLGGPEPPLSFAQERLWVLAQLDSTDASYHVPGAFRFSGRLAAGALDDAVQALVARHETLRSRFPAREGRATCVIEEPSRRSMPRVDLGGIAPPDRERDLMRRARREAVRPFDLERGPLLRTRLIRLAPAEHVFLVTQHHVISDGWSLGIFTEEATRLYEAFRAGQPSPLAELPIQYGDYAAWQRRRLDDEILREQVDFFRRELAGIPLLTLPTDRPRPAVQSFRGGSVRLAVPAEQAVRLERWARERGATMFMLLLAVYQLFLARAGGQRRVAVGSPVAGRDRQEVEGLVGCFVNTLVFSGDMPAGLSLEEHLVRVRDRSLAVFAHQEVPFERLVAELAPERSLSQTPLFQAMLAFQQTGGGDPSELTDLDLEPMTLDAPVAKFDLTLDLTRTRDGGLAGRLEFRRDLFDRSTVQRFARRLQALLVVAAQGAGEWRVPVGRLPWMMPAERHQVLAEWNDTAWPPEADGGETTLVDGLRRAREQRPDAVAVVFEEQHLSYGELGRRVRGLARRLREEGVGRDQPVGVVMERCLELPGVLCGVLEADGAYVPIDPEYPEARVALMVEDALAPGAVVLVARHLARRFTGTGSQLRIVCVENAWQSEALDQDVTTGLPTAADQLAYVLYTSGSTGRPKGVMVSHRGIVNRLLWMQAEMGLTPRDRVIQKTPISFDVSVWELFWPLMTGATEVVARPGGHRDREYLARTLEREGVTTIHFVPSMLQAFLAGDVSGCRSLYRVVASGEALPEVLARRSLAALPGELYNLYGPTEAAVDVTWWPCRRAGVDGGVPIGRPVAATRVLVLDGEGEPAPVGIPGEVHLAGVQLARGYLRRSALTAERFVPAPCTSRPGDRLYRTGDLGRTRPRGEVEFLGRLDDQVKVRGVRLELGEVEAALTELPEVREAVAAVRHDGPGGEWLVAYVVPENGVTVDVRSLRAHLSERLPAAAVPGAFVTLPSLPLTPSGKADRSALPAPATGRAESEPFAPPRTEAEQLLAELWARVLRVESVGARDNFFELGGDSILGLQVVAAAREKGLRIDPQDLFRRPVLAELAAGAERIGRAGGTEAAAEPDTVREPIAPTPIQQWFFETAGDDPVVLDHFNQAVLVALQRSIGTDVLAQAQALLMDRHDALRLRFVPPSREGGEAGSWHQVPTDRSDTPPVARVDLSAVPERRRAAEQERFAAGLHDRLDVRRGPILRLARITGFADVRDRLLWVIHHLAVDGVSWRVLLEELEAACGTLSAGEPPHLSPPSASFVRWAGAVRQEATSATTREERRLWVERLRRGAEPLPVDFPGGERTVASAASVTVELPEDETRELVQALPVSTQIRVPEVLLSALACAVTGWTGSPRVLVDVEGHGRNELPGLDDSRTVGWLTALYPVLLNLEGGGNDRREILKRIKEQVRSTPRNGVGFGWLRYQDGGDAGAELRRFPDAQILFNYLGRLDLPLSGSAFFAPATGSSGSPRGPRIRRPHLLEIHGGIVSGRLRLDWIYGTETHRRDTVFRLAESFRHALREILDAVRSGVGSLLTPSDVPEARVSQSELDKLMGQIRKTGTPK